MIRFLTTLAVLFPLTANSQVASPMDDAACTASYDSIAALSFIPPEYEVGPRAVDGWCEVTGLTVQVENTMDLVMDRVRWRAADHERLAEGLPPTALNLEIDAIKYVDASGDVLFRYLMELQMAQASVDVSVDAYWDEATNVVHLVGAKALFADDNAIEMSGTWHDIDLTDQASMARSAGALKMKSSEVRIDTTWLFQSYVAMPLGYGLLYDSTDPEAEVERLKAEAAETLAGVPTRIVDADSQDALQRLLADLPEPRGQITLALSSDAGIGAATFMPLALRGAPTSAEEIWSLLTDLEITATYARKDAP